MRRQTWQVIFSIFLILMGVGALLSNLNLLPFAINNNQLLWLIVFGVVGLGFLAAFLSSVQENWWAIIPSLTLLGLAALIGLEGLWNVNGGTLFLGSIGLSFLIVFLTAPRERWWAIIPGGTLATLAGITQVAELPNGGFLSGGLLFIGLGVTFFLVYLVTRMAWALWPAGVLAVFGSLLLLGAGNLAALVFPALLILVGAWLILRSSGRKAQ